MARPPRILRSAALMLSLILGAGVVCLGGATFLGGTKTRALFGASADALAGQRLDGGTR